MTYDSIEDTKEHIKKVIIYIKFFSALLNAQALEHDYTKLNEPEKEAFDKATPMLKKLTYGSKEYQDSLKALGESLKHHYEHNRHHPQHFKNGINDMNLVDLIEMFCDWCAATERHEDGNILKSIELNKEKFNISEQLTQIFINTVNNYSMGKDG